MGQQDFRMGCLKFLALSVFISCTAYAFDAVNVLNSTNNPVNVTCVSGCSGSSGSAVSTFSIVNVATVTFNGASQPVSLTGFPLSATGVNASSVTVHNSVLDPLQTVVNNAVLVLPQVLTGSGYQNVGYQAGYSSMPVSIQNSQLPVTGTFFQATQPVSLASMPSTPVTGTFWQATQPVSGSLSVSNFPASQSVKIDGSSNTVQITGTPSVNVQNFPASQAVTGTFWPATQPVSLTGYPLIPTGVNASTTAVINQAGNNLNVSIAAGSIANTGFNVNNTPAVTQSGTWSVNSTAVNTTTVTFNGVAQPVTAPALTKGTQGANGFSTQDLKDAGRTFIVFVATAAAGVTTEGLIKFQQNKGGVVTTSVTSYVITSGKTLRILGLYCSDRDGAAAISWGRFVLRSNTAGATTASSNSLFSIEIGGAAALAGGTGTFSSAFVDGLEIAGNGTISIGVTQIDSATTNLDTCTLIAYEY